MHFPKGQICTARTEVYGLHLIASHSEDKAGNFNLVLGICLIVRYKGLMILMPPSHNLRHGLVAFLQQAHAHTKYIRINTLNCVRRID